MTRAKMRGSKLPPAAQENMILQEPPGDAIPTPEAIATIRKPSLQQSKLAEHSWRRIKWIFLYNFNSASHLPSIVKLYLSCNYHMEDYSSLKNEGISVCIAKFSTYWVYNKTRIWLVYFRHFVLIELFHFVCDQCDVKFKWWIFVHYIIIEFDVYIRHQWLLKSSGMFVFLHEIRLVLKHFHCYIQTFICWQNINV